MLHVDLAVCGNAAASLRAGTEEYASLLGEAVNLTKRLQALTGQPAAVLHPIVEQLRPTAERMVAVAAVCEAAAAAVRAAKGPAVAGILAEIKPAAAEGLSIDLYVAALAALERADASLPAGAWAGTAEAMRSQCDRLTSMLGDA